VRRHRRLAERALHACTGAATHESHLAVAPRRAVEMAAARTSDCSWSDGPPRAGMMMMLSSIQFLLVSSAAAAAGEYRTSKVPTRPMHFVVALIDDLGGYNVPWRNVEQTRSDDLLRLSTQEGMRLENFYTFKYCSPTRSSFLSGRFPCHVNQRNGMPCPGCDGCDGGGIDLRMKLLPQKLGDNYRSYMVGKGHIGSRSVGHLPINRGFTSHLGFLGGGEDHWQCNGRRHSCDGNASSTNGVHCLCAPEAAKRTTSAATASAHAVPCSTLKPPFCNCRGGAGNVRNCSCASCPHGQCGCKSCQICNSPHPGPPPPPKQAKPVDLWLDRAPAYGLNGTYSCQLYSSKAVALIEDHAANYASHGMLLYLPCKSHHVHALELCHHCHVLSYRHSWVVCRADHDVHSPYEALDSYRDPAITDSGRQTMQAMVSCVSEGTGNVTRALKRAGMWDTTLFLWSSDNGGPQYWLANNYPLRGGSKFSIRYLPHYNRSCARMVDE
jgi:hypothetical protein